MTDGIKSGIAAVRKWTHAHTVLMQDSCPKELSAASVLADECERLAKENAEMKASIEGNAKYFTDEIHHKTAALGRSLENEVVLRNELLSLVEEDATLRAEIAQLRGAICRAGFGIMETSGDWSIHDLSEKAKEDDRRTAEVIVKNIGLEIEVKRLGAMIAELVTGIRGLLTCSLPVDVSGQRMVDMAREALAKATEGQSS